ncbi:MAG: DUF192 domain-containing protein [Treponema sp.]|nr:DUF192 domain-containing protein [Treponema sp.]
MSSRLLRITSWLILFFVFISCAAQSSESRSNQDGKPQTGLTTKIISITGEEGAIAVEVELAQTDEQRTIGLMYRTNLEDSKGMLFIFNEDQILSFWMKNTIIPLSIAYISYDGTIVDIRDMYPNNTSPVQSSRSVRYALEVPQGWFGRVGIKAGDKVTL